MTYITPKTGTWSDGGTEPRPHIKTADGPDKNGIAGVYARPFMRPEVPDCFYPAFAWHIENI